MFSLPPPVLTLIGDIMDAKPLNHRIINALNRNPGIICIVLVKRYRSIYSGDMTQSSDFTRRAAVA
jgi:hypothetical protein